MTTPEADAQRHIQTVETMDVFRDSAELLWMAFEGPVEEKMIVTEVRGASTFVEVPGLGDKYEFEDGVYADVVEIWNDFCNQNRLPEDYTLNLFELDSSRPKFSIQAIRAYLSSGIVHEEKSNV